MTPVKARKDLSVRSLGKSGWRHFVVSLSAFMTGRLLSCMCAEPHFLDANGRPDVTWAGRDWGLCRNDDVLSELESQTGRNGVRSVGIFPAGW